MANDFYNPTGWPGTGVAGASAPGRAELVLIGQGCDKLPPLTAHPSEFVRVNAGATALESITPAATLSAIGAQPLDADLTAIAGLTSAADKGIQFTGSGTAATYTLTTAGKALLDDATTADQRTTLGSTTVGDAVFIAASTAAARTAIGAVIGTNVQAWDADLDAVAALAATAGMLARTGAGAFAVRTLGAPAAGLTWTNGDGSAGAPTLALANDLAAVEGLGSTGIAVRTAADTWAQRSIAGTGPISVTNGDGVSGNPTITTSMATARLLGRTTAATGVAEEISVGAGLTFSGGSLSQTTATPSAASQADQETGSSTTVYVTPGRQQFHPSAAKAWVQYDSTGGRAASYNCSSVTDNAAGNLSPNWTVAMSGASYVVVATALNSQAGTAVTTYVAQVISQSTSNVNICTVQLSGFAQIDAVLVNVAAFGDQ